MLVITIIPTVLIRPFHLRTVQTKHCIQILQQDKDGAASRNALTNASINCSNTFNSFRVIVQSQTGVVERSAAGLSLQPLLYNHIEPTVIRSLTQASNTLVCFDVDAFVSLSFDSPDSVSFQLYRVCAQNKGQISYTLL